MIQFVNRWLFSTKDQNDLPKAGGRERVLDRVEVFTFALLYSILTLFLVEFFQFLDHLLNVLSHSPLFSLEFAELRSSSAPLLSPPLVGNCAGPLLLELFLLVACLSLLLYGAVTATSAGGGYPPLLRSVSWLALLPLLLSLLLLENSSLLLLENRPLLANLMLGNSYLLASLLLGNSPVGDGEVFIFLPIFHWAGVTLLFLSLLAPLQCARAKLKDLADRFGFWFDLSLMEVAYFLNRPPRGVGELLVRTFGFTLVMNVSIFLLSLTPGEVWSFLMGSVAYALDMDPSDPDYPRYIHPDRVRQDPALAIIRIPPPELPATGWVARGGRWEWHPRLYIADDAYDPVVRIPYNSGRARLFSGIGPGPDPWCHLNRLGLIQPPTGESLFHAAVRGSGFPPLPDNIFWKPYPKFTLDGHPVLILHSAPDDPSQFPEPDEGMWTYRKQEVSERTIQKKLRRILGPPEIAEYLGSNPLPPRIEELIGPLPQPLGSVGPDWNQIPPQFQRLLESQRLLPPPDPVGVESGDPLPPAEVDPVRPDPSPPVEGVDPPPPAGVDPVRPDPSPPVEGVDPPPPCWGGSGPTRPLSPGGGGGSPPPCWGGSGPTRPLSPGGGGGSPPPCWGGPGPTRPLSPGGGGGSPPPCWGGPGPTNLLYPKP